MRAGLEGNTQHIISTFISNNKIVKLIQFASLHRISFASLPYMDEEESSE